MYAMRNRTGALLAVLLLASSLACSRSQTDAGQWVFDTPEAAANAFVEALEKDAVEALRGIFGPEYEADLVTSHWQEESEARRRIAKGAREKLSFGEVEADEIEIIVGDAEWPFPIHLVRYEDGWLFDTKEGLEVITDRRIGRNELAAIAIARAYVDAQIEYAREDHDGDEVLEYAQRLVSTPGSESGLYWEAGPDEEESPFGPLVKGAARDFDSLDPADPLRGYYFQILTKQGPNAPGGSYDYLVDGNMVSGFGLVAYPADYQTSGVMTFVVNHASKVYQKDIGAFSGMEAFDPDDSWTLVED
jgi:hypothetical protein